jgi:transcriptional regulator with XRE-family HTH domain
MGYESGTLTLESHDAVTAINKLQTAPPYPVEQAIKLLGGNIRTARLRRNLTIADLAEKIGTGTRPVADAEKGKPSTGIAVYVASLWALGLLDSLANVAAPEQDEEGQTLALARERDRARPTSELDNDF